MAKKDPLDDVIAELRKNYGTEAVMRLSDQPAEAVKVIPTGSMGLDRALGVGGYPRGRIIEIMGWESCLDGDTFVKFNLRWPDGRVVNGKGGTLRRLWERFHREEPARSSSRGSWSGKVPEGVVFTAPSVNEDDRIFHNLIRDVVRIGTRECFTLTTFGGRSITGTADHKFWNGTKFVRLGDLAEGDTVMVHNNTPFSCEAAGGGAPERAYLYVKAHPVAGVKVVRTVSNRTTGQKTAYTYHRLLRSRAVVEAGMNHLSLEQYVELLNRGDIAWQAANLRVLERDDHVHHLDEDITNDTPTNLVVISAQEHGRLHAMERHNNLRFVATQDVVESVEPVGLREVFDLKMEAPFNNYVADQFVTHNSGKTTLSLHAIVNAQACGEAVAFIDAEHAYDPVYGRALGVDEKRLLISQPDSGEQALSVTEDLARSGQVALIVVDSVAALVPQAELDGEMGDLHMGLQARLMSQALRKLTAIAHKTDTTIIFINQYRMKIGVVFGNPITTPGGNALKFYASVRLEVSKKKQEGVPEGAEATGNTTRVKVVKNKVAPPFKEATFDILFGRGIDHEGELLTMAIELGIVEKNGAWYSTPHDGQKLAQGMNKTKDLIREDHKLFGELMVRVRSALLPSPTQAET